MKRENRDTAKSVREVPSKGYLFEGLLLFAACLFLICFFARTFTTPWVEDSDFNGAVWSQAAHNFHLSGIAATFGVPAPFYYDDGPPPREEYYNHHPALLALEVDGAFAIFGEHEWAARLVPMLASLGSVLLLWMLVRQSAGPRVAALSALLFAFLPMELAWGRMVNFEPLTLPWLLAGFLGLNAWHRTGETRWRAVMYAGFSLAMLTSWMGYIFTLVVCAGLLLFERRTHARTALTLLAIALAAGGLFLLQIRLADPDGLQDISQALQFRLSHSTGSRSFTALAWMTKTGGSFLQHFPTPFLILAAAGAIAWIKNRTSAQKFGIGWVTACFFIGNALYDIVFPNASYIHDYASYYFVVPVALMAGIGLNFIVGHLAKSGVARDAVNMTLVLVTVMLGVLGWQTAKSLRRPAHILDWNMSEPANLIPELGEVIRTQLPPDAMVMVNFVPAFSPQLCYYAHTKLANAINSADDWEYYLTQTDDKKAGIIWMGDPESKKIIALLKPETLHPITIENTQFMIWKP